MGRPKRESCTKGPDLMTYPSKSIRSTTKILCGRPLIMALPIRSTCDQLRHQSEADPAIHSQAPRSSKKRPRSSKKMDASHSAFSTQPVGDCDAPWEAPQDACGVSVTKKRLQPATAALDAERVVRVHARHV